MKKVFLILILFLSCYIIYNNTIDNKIFYLTIGDFLSKGTNEYGISSYGYSDFIKDYEKLIKDIEEAIKNMKDFLNKIENGEIQVN